MASDHNMGFDVSICNHTEQDDALKQKCFRVTEILSRWSGLDRIPTDIVENAAARGTRVHNACEAIMKGLGEWGIDNEIRPYVESFKQWYTPDMKILAIEQRFYCNDLHITGQVDMIVNTDHGACIVDLKTSSSPSKTWPLQGSAYKYLARKHGYDIQGIQFLHLNRYGKRPKVYEYEDQWDTFKKCLDIHNYFYRKEE